MLIQPASRDRPFHFGPHPFEVLGRDEAVVERELAIPCEFDLPDPAQGSNLADIIERYADVYAAFAAGDVSPAKAPVPDDLQLRAREIKGGAYFMDAAGAGICRVPASAWQSGCAIANHAFAIVVLTEPCSLPEEGTLAAEWVAGSSAAALDLHACEIALSIAGHIRNMGFDARAHVIGDCLVDRRKLAVLAGVAVRQGRTLVAPFIGEAFGMGVVTTDYELPVDLPLDPGMRYSRLRHWIGINGARSGREVNRRRKRLSHLSRYPMETVRRVDRPTTLVLDDEVPRVPKRAAFFQRALHGDLGEKARRERGRFAFKTPFSMSMLSLIRALVPHQDGPVADRQPRLEDEKENARAIKSLSYFLGSDLTGICEIPRYAWFSHREDGSAIAPYHTYAVVMLIDQGYDTMEGASGDDWASGPQSMRAYLRGARIAGVMAAFLREKGVEARPQTNADSDVLHIPLVLLAGLGEMSRIGELVLNPFVGPRFKSVVLTTNLPLEADRPIDFGLQAFCGHCRKCARECPCDAIPLGGKVMFNGYETWKPDVERCTRYRLTNQRGAACGRCMKTCPINKVVDADGALLTRVASWLGVNAMWLKPVMVPFAAWFDDWIGNGRRNPAKKWWFDHEMIDGIAVDAVKGTNERDIDVNRPVDPKRQSIAVYTADLMPPPDLQDPYPLDRKLALKRAGELETAEGARSRAATGGGPPQHSIATPPSGASRETSSRPGSPYK